MIELKRYFPQLKEREELLREIEGNKKLHNLYNSWEEKYKQEFLDFCTGVSGSKVVYDAFFKEVMNPEYAPERLNELLSVVLEQEVKIKVVLPNDATRIGNESSLLIMDIVVELSDGSLANVEMQKIGYMFPGTRSACYSSDLLLRQYRRIWAEKGERFSFHDIKSVYTIVLFEKSPKEFKKFPNQYKHFFKQTSDTGLEMDLLQKYIFISLDIFKINHQNKRIESKLEAWLTFFSDESPERIIEVIERYPQFKKLYNDIYQMCLDTEKVMDMFSEELRIMDRNTEKLMVIEMQKEIEQQKQEIEQQKQEMKQQKQELEQKDLEIEHKDAEMELLRKELEATKALLVEK